MVNVPFKMLVISGYVKRGMPYPLAMGLAPGSSPNSSWDLAAHNFVTKDDTIT